MEQLAFDFDGLIDDAHAEQFQGLDVIERFGKPHHIIRDGSKIVGYSPVGMVVPLLPCGAHEHTPAGLEDCAGACFGFVCPVCGEDAGAYFPFKLNHDKHGREGDCVSRWLKINHTWSAYRQLLARENPESEPAPFTNCWIAEHNHKDGHKRGGWPVSCLIATLVNDYERCVRMGVTVDRLPPIDLHKLKEEL